MHASGFGASDSDSGDAGEVGRLVEDAFYNIAVLQSSGFLVNDGLSSMQKQTMKRSKSGSKFIHEQFPL